MRARIKRTILALSTTLALAMAPLPGVVKADAVAAAPSAPAQVSEQAPARTADQLRERRQTKLEIQAPDQVSSELREQAQAKAEKQGQLARVQAASARPGEALDMSQVSVAAPIARGDLQPTPDTQGAYAYVQLYREPDDYAHRNYCGPGSAVALLSHFDPDYPKVADIDQVGREMQIDPNMGVWIRDIAKPVNDRLNAMAGQELNWYQSGKAQSLEDLRYIIQVDIIQNGVPFITGLETGGLPGWNSDVGHIIAVYGYTRKPDGSEWVHYIDTAPPGSGYQGYMLNTVELGQFWQAVSENSVQIW